MNYWVVIIGFGGRKEGSKEGVGDGRWEVDDGSGDGGLRGVLLCVCMK